MTGANNVPSSYPTMTLKILSWNIEGILRNIFNLKHLVQTELPSLIFLSEPWLHLSDSPLALDLLAHHYNYFLNSEDRHDDLLSLKKSRAHGGTLSLWDKDLDPYITILEPRSSRILALVLDKPGYQISIHLNIYLHTAGKEANFLEDLAQLEDILDEVSEKYPDSITYIRGDANSSPVPRTLNKRDFLFKHFLETNNLGSVPTHHNTYHHFTNAGMSDSSIDVLLYKMVTSEGAPNTCIESLLKVLCSKTNSLIDSSHDAIITSVSFPSIPSHIPKTSNNKTAPMIPNLKYKVNWSDEGILE